LLLLRAEDEGEKARELVGGKEIDNLFDWLIVLVRKGDLKEKKISDEGLYSDIYKK